MFKNGGLALKLEPYLEAIGGACGIYECTFKTIGYIPEQKAFQ